MTYQETLKNVSMNADSSIGAFTGIEGMPGAASPIYGKLYCAVKITGSKTVGLCTSSDRKIQMVGVLQNKPQKIGTGATVALRLAGGVTNFFAGAGGVSAGDGIKLDANGHGVTATPTTDDALVIGWAVTAAVSGSVFPMMFA
jgi:hypothetical protein